MFTTKKVTPKYAYRKTRTGTWKKHVSEKGEKFGQFQSHASVGGRPLIAVTYGTDPETGKMAIADGVIAVGQRARGFVAVGQFVNGYFSVGQFATGRIAAFGQFVAAPLAIGQLSIAVFTIAQMGVALTGIFQFGVTALGGIGQFVFDLSRLFLG